MSTREFGGSASRIPRLVAAPGCGIRAPSALQDPDVKCAGRRSTLVCTALRCKAQNCTHWQLLRLSKHLLF
jgi:hypothetical protein